MKKKVYIRNGEYYYSTGIVSEIFEITTEQLTDRARKRNIRPLTIFAHSYYSERDIRLLSLTRPLYKRQFYEWDTCQKFEDVYNYLVDEREDER